VFAGIPDFICHFHFLRDLGKDLLASDYDLLRQRLRKYGLFRDFRRGARRKCGHNSISRFLQSMIADTPLVRNLENPNYLKVLLDGQSTLEERFAQIPVDTVRKELQDASNSPEKVPSKIRQLIHVQTFPETICRLSNKAA